MKISAKSVALFSLALTAVSFANSASSFAYQRCYRVNWHYTRCEYVSDPVADGFAAGFASAFLSLYSLVTAAEASHHSETLLVEAQAYQDLGIKGAVFSSISSKMMEGLQEQMGDQLKGMDQSTLDDLIAEKIKDDAAAE